MAGPRPSRSPLLLIITALVLWCGYVAYGAMAGNTEQGPAWMAPRGPIKAVIVVACVVAFLGLWAVVLLRPNSSRGAHRAATPGGARSTPAGASWLSATSLAVQLSAYIPWLAWHWGRPQAMGASADARRLLALFAGSVMATGIALVLAMIGLSDPAPRRYKLLGLVTIALAALCVLAWSLVRPG